MSEETLLTMEVLLGFQFVYLNISLNPSRVVVITSAYWYTIYCY